MSSATSKGTYRTYSRAHNSIKRNRGRPRKIYREEDVSRLQDHSEEEKPAQEEIEMSDKRPDEEKASELDDPECGEIEWLLSDSELADIEDFAENTLAEQKNEAEEENNGNEQEETVKINNTETSNINKISLLHRTCIQCMKKQPCYYQYSTEDNGTAYLCSEACVKNFQSGQARKYCEHLKYLIEEISPKLLTCSECEEKKICYFYNNYNGNDFHYCSMSCLNSMMANEANKYVFKKLNIVEVDEITPKEAECCVCKMYKKCSFFLTRYGENLLVCALDCMKTLNDRENGRYLINRNITKKYPKQSQNPPELRVAMNNVDEHFLKAYKRTDAMVQAAKEERRQTFIRKCDYCKHVLNDIIIDETLLSWEAMEFCGEVCLEMYQKKTGARCSNCKEKVEHTSLGKYCVRFGSNIQQFCNSLCLLEFKKRLKSCSYCQKDISVGDQGFLAAVGNKGQFKHFCSQDCVDKFEMMCVNKNSFPRPVTTKCFMCSLVKATSIEVEMSMKPTQRFCSESCFVAYKHITQIFLDQCHWCRKFFERQLKKCFTIYQGTDAYCFCSNLCMNIYISNARSIVPCEWCKVQKYNFDMIRAVHPNGQIMMCSLNCLTLYKVTVNAMSSKEIRAECQICKKYELAQYHITMSDASVKNFCSRQCVTTFQGKFLEDALSLPLRASIREQVVPAGAPKRTFPAKKRNVNAKGQQQVVMPVISNIRSLVAPPPLTPAPTVTRPLYQQVSEPKSTVPKTPPTLLKSPNLLPPKSSLLRHSPLKSPSPPHSPLKSLSPPHSPLKSPSPPHSPLKSPSPPHSPLKSPSPPHSLLKSPNPPHSSPKSRTPSPLPKSTTPPPKSPTPPPKSPTPPPKSPTPPPKSPTPLPLKSPTLRSPKSPTPPPPKSRALRTPKSPTPPPPKSTTPRPPKIPTPPPKSPTSCPPKSPTPPPKSATSRPPKSPTQRPLKTPTPPPKIPLSAPKLATSHSGPKFPTSLSAPKLATSHSALKFPTSLSAPKLATSHSAPKFPTSLSAPKLATSHPAQKFPTSLSAPKFATSHSAQKFPTPPSNFSTQLSSRPPALKVYKRVNLKIVASREKPNTAEASSLTTSPPTIDKPGMVSKGVSCGPELCTKETQTDSSFERRVLIPIPVPIYVPVPCTMWSSPFPVPVPIPLPIPTPVFIPTTRNSAKGIMKEINKLQDKMPTDPIEAELLMMADMVASDQKKDESNSDSGDEDEKNNSSLMGINDDNAFGEDMLQMPLMTLKYEHQPVDLDCAVVANAIITSPHTAPRKRAPALSSCARTSKRRRAEQEPTPLPEPPPEPAEPAEKPDANMCLKYTFGVNAWKQWVMTKNAEIEKSSIRRKPFKSEILQLTADELNYSLCLFVKEVRKPNGSEYAPDTIYYLVSGIQLYLYENGRIDNIFTDPYYEKFTDSLDEVVQNFTALYNDSQFILTRMEEEHLWESKQLGAHSPHVLLSTLMFFNTFYFNLMTVEEHMQLSFSYLLKHRKTNLVVDGVKITSLKKEVLRYQPPHFAQETNPKKKKWYEQPPNEENPFRCPVRLFEFYISKCPDSVRTRNDVFYLQPERSCVPESPIWYSTQPLSRHELSKMLNRIKTIKEINFVLIHS